MSRRTRWHRVLDVGTLEPGRVVSVAAGHRSIALTHFDGMISALDNRCPHQGGPLGEGSIENGWLRCPWHGWDFHPCTGKPPGGFDDGVETFPVETRDDGIYVGVPEEAEPDRTISDVMAHTMVAWDIRHCWGMVGHSNLGLAEAIRRRVEAGEMHYYGIRHEGAAAFAAAAYGKLTGRPAACLAIAGPGATNLLTGLWDAHVDRAPVLALTGQVNTQFLGPGAFQEIDLAGAFGKVAQWGQTVLHNSNHAELVNLACKTAILNRGVSHLIFPDEVQVLPAAEAAAPGAPEGRVAEREIAPPASALDAATELLRGAKRPVIIVGHGARFHMPDVVALAELLGAAVLTTFKGKGLIADDHPLGCGVLGRSGTPIASWFMNESDALVVFGASFSNHTGITPKKPTIQVDFDPMMLGKFHAVDIPLWGEIGVTARLLAQHLGRGTNAVDQRPEVAQRWEIWRAEKARRANDTSSNGLSSAALFAALSRHVPEDAILAVDVGNNTYSFGRYFECRKHAVLMSGYLGSIGFALPAAFGAWAATRETDTPFHGRKVVSVSGDGGLGQYLADFTTAVKYGMNITHVVLHNGELGKISKEQKAGEWDVWETSLHNPSFAAYAELCGGLGIRVEATNELDAALTKALAAPGPALVEVMTDPLLI
ncbi:MAG: thiamine pyrophosphate-binding protein [Planctomycetota bacterium]